MIKKFIAALGIICLILGLASLAEAGKVYLLSGADSVQDTAIKAALEGFGHQVTIGVEHQNFDGSQSLSGYDVVIFLDSNNFGPTDEWAIARYAGCRPDGLAQFYPGRGWVDHRRMGHLRQLPNPSLFYHPKRGVAWHMRMEALILYLLLPIPPGPRMPSSTIGCLLPLLLMSPIITAPNQCSC